MAKHRSNGDSIVGNIGVSILHTRAFQAETDAISELTAIYDKLIDMDETTRKCVENREQEESEYECS